MTNSFTITKTARKDLEEILQLQYLAYQSEAALFGNKDIPPLKETIEEVIAEFELFTSTRSVDNIRLYESVGYREFDRRAVDDELVFVYMEK